MSDESDEELIHRVLDGNDRAFELLVSRYQDRVARFVWRVVSQAEDKEEVCQDVFVKVFFNLHQFRFDAKFSTWLYQIAYRSAVTFKRRKRIRTEEFKDDVAAPVPTLEEDSHRDSVKAVLDIELAKLKLEERTIVALYYLQELGIEEIATIVNRPGGTIKSILHRVRGKLQASIERANPGIREAV